MPAAGTTGCSSSGGAPHHAPPPPPTDITALSLDAWAAIASHLSLTSLVHLSQSSWALHNSIIGTGSNALWAAHAVARWGPHATSAWVQQAAAAAAQQKNGASMVVVDWPQAYRHAHHAGCQLRTRQPLAIGPLRLQEEEPAADEFHASLPASARLLFCRSGSSSSTAGSGEAPWPLPSGVLAAAVDSRLAWWRVSGQAGRGEAAGGGRPCWVLQDARAASTFGGAYVSALCALPAASGAPGAPPRCACDDLLGARKAGGQVAHTDMTHTLLRTRVHHLRCLPLQVCQRRPGVHHQSVGPTEQQQQLGAGGLRLAHRTRRLPPGGDAADAHAAWALWRHHRTAVSLQQ